MAEVERSAGPDFRNGVALSDVPDGAVLAGRVDDQDAILIRRGDALYAVGAHCTHYHGPLAEGLVVGATLRCPWHHACFDLGTGEALRAPAIDPIPCWRVERVGDVAFVRDPIVRTPAKRPARTPRSIVIIGGGAAGLAAAEMLRREGHDGPLTMLSADDSPPCDRPNLSKDFLAGTAPDDWIPLRPPEFYREHDIDLRLGTRVSAIDVPGKAVVVDGGPRIAFDSLLIATGADPVRLAIPGADQAIHYLRTFADSRAIVARAKTAKRVAIIGASFIGLEVAASLRARNIDVHVIGPESVPLERVLGSRVGQFIRELHESHGVAFHLGTTPSRVEGRKVTLADGTLIDADFVVVGVGVRASIALAESAGMTIDRGIAVDARLRTSVPDVYAAGDVARWPDPHSGERIRVEHWVVAQRQGQVAAQNMLGRDVPFDAVPFFWSQHYDVAINYVGHAEKWDAVEIDGSLAQRDCEIRYKLGDRVLAVATLGRDRQSLAAEVAMEAHAI
jgi:NADPH-dependent 2,4-dienoyl-CoA reductase/sulfur reductase-like enzyme/nitrite reductase/ring-hydroxylating ferredoxin subunit